MHQSNDALRRAYASERQARFRERQHAVPPQSVIPHLYQLNDHHIHRMNHSLYSQANIEMGRVAPHHHHTRNMSHLYNDLDNLHVDNIPTGHSLWTTTLVIGQSATGGSISHLNTLQEGLATQMFFSQIYSSPLQHHQQQYSSPLHHHPQQYSSPLQHHQHSTVHPPIIANTSTVHPLNITNTSTVHPPNITNNLFLSTESTDAPILSLGIFFILNNQSIQLMSGLHPHICIMNIHNRAGSHTPIKIVNLLIIFVLHQ
ncbi:hypothetical protein KEM48_002514 [Puccinia striiformis f. sp. tritici PST-130]|nr:hypothetical protein KEM48_002514 [Puccinia striiformis f. sp. tritici PST-130]